MYTSPYLRPHAVRRGDTRAPVSVPAASCRKILGVGEDGTAPQRSEQPVPRHSSGVAFAHPYAGLRRAPPTSDAVPASIMHPEHLPTALGPPASRRLHRCVGRDEAGGLLRSREDRVWRGRV